jgi:hypothetical protein
MVVPLEFIGQSRTHAAISNSHKHVMSMSSKWATHIQGASSFGPRFVTLTPSAFSFGTIGGEILAIPLTTNPQGKKGKRNVIFIGFLRMKRLPIFPRLNQS